jgi:hypothetical protein
VTELENGILARFGKRTDRWCTLAGASVTKTATLLGVLRVTVSKAMSVAYINHGKTTLAKRNSGQKSTLTERDH